MTKQSYFYGSPGKSFLCLQDRKGQLDHRIICKRLVLVSGRNVQFQAIFCPETFRYKFRVFFLLSKLATRGTKRVWNLHILTLSAAFSSNLIPSLLNISLERNAFWYETIGDV